MDKEELNNLFSEFQSTWPLERIKDMGTDDYSLGNKDSFCYWIEFKLKEWGSVQGGNASKFVIYKYNTKPKDEDPRLQSDDTYAWYRKMGKSTSEDAFKEIRSALVTIIESVQSGDLKGIDGIDVFGHTIKWKIAFHYQDLNNPLLLPIFKREWLHILEPECTDKTPSSEIYGRIMARKPADKDVKEYSDELGKKLWQEGVELDDDNDNSVVPLEPYVAFYLTQYDDETFNTEQLVEIYRKTYKSAQKGKQSLVSNLFGVLYAPHIKDLPSNGRKSIAEQALGAGKVGSMGDEIGRGIEIGLDLRNHIDHKSSTFRKIADISSDTCYQYLAALRTKPFMLLAGISGTGKSRIVRKLAQASVTEGLQKEYDAKSIENGFDRWQLHKPANFELVQVKPNWHNSLEVVGYKSNIGGTHYEYTPFVEFVARAWKHPEVPFFLCLDEMNLAPVEQYFAEFLSAIESRSMENGMYETDPIIKPFSEFGSALCDEMLAHLANDDDNLRERFENKGLTLPANLFVLGTVNMDETTFSFSRKVLDRAMSIVMNEVDYNNFFKGLTERNVDELSETFKTLLIKREIRGLDAANNGIEDVRNYLVGINKVLDNTPFKLGYRAANEALLYVDAAYSFNPGITTTQALDEFTMMKILSRIEGDKRSIGTILTVLKNVITENYPKSHKKLAEMEITLANKQFVSYWS